MRLFYNILTIVILRVCKADKNLANERYKEAHEIASREMGLNRKYERDHHVFKPTYGYGLERGRERLRYGERFSSSYGEGY